MLLYNSSSLLDSINFNGLTTSGKIPISWFGIDRSLVFHSGLEYTFTTRVMCSKVNSSEYGKVDVYLVGSAFPSSNPLGYKVTSYESLDGEHQFYRSLDEVNFIAPSSGIAYLRFVITSGNWYFSNIAVISSLEMGFNCDDVSFYVPVKNKRKEYLQFKAELYDVNNNIVPITLETSPSYFDGGNSYIKGDDNVITGTVAIALDGASGPIINAHKDGSTISIGGN